MVPSATTVLRLRFCVKIGLRATALFLLYRAYALGYDTLSHNLFERWKAAGRATLPPNTNWFPPPDPFMTASRHVFVYAGAAIGLIVFERLIVRWLIPAPARRCPVC